MAKPEQFFMQSVIMRSNYKAIHRAQLKENSLTSQTFQWRLTGRKLGRINQVTCYLATSGAIYLTLIPSKFDNDIMTSFYVL